MSSIYLHCDQSASHHIKILLDMIFGEQNFRNEIVWSYRTGGISKKYWPRKHDAIFFYTKNDYYVFNILKEKSYTKAKSRRPGMVNYAGAYVEFYEDEKGVYNWVNIRDVWDIPYVNNMARERTNYPTQKPLAVLERIIQGSSNNGHELHLPTL